MDVMTVQNNNNIKKIRPITSFSIITLSVLLLIYAVIINKLIVILVVFILVLKVIDLIVNLFRIRGKKHIFNFKTDRKEV